MHQAPDKTPPEEENKYHTYITNRIPWWVHLIWVSFWILAIWYVLSFQFPIIGTEILNPP